MGEGAAAVLAELYAQGRLDGVLAVGGSGGSSIEARAVRDLPIGLPKLIVSTVAFGDVSPYAGAKDVTLMYSVVDIAGVNRVSAHILGNAAAAVAGMASVAAPVVGDARPLVAASMFGVVTPAVDAARERLDELGYEVLVFHATGSGGRALETLAGSGLVAGVLDLTTTELADDLVGGDGRAGSQGGRQVARRHRPHRAVPRGGVSAFDAPGADFHDPKADQACFEARGEGLGGSAVEVEELDLHVNDPVFGRAMADRLHLMITTGGAA